MTGLRQRVAHPSQSWSPENSEADRIHLGPDSCLPSPQSELWEFSYKRDILEVSQSMYYRLKLRRSRKGVGLISLKERKKPTNLFRKALLSFVLQTLRTVWQPTPVWKTASSLVLQGVPAAKWACATRPPYHWEHWHCTLSRASYGQTHKPEVC